MGGPDKKRNARNRFMKRCKTLRSKASQLADLCDAKVYLFVKDERWSFVYNSVDDGSWPPPNELLEEHFPDLARKGANRKKAQKYNQYFAARWQLLRSWEDVIPKGDSVKKRITRSGHNRNPSSDQDRDAQESDAQESDAQESDAQDYDAQV
ncbi:hypothetical protein N7490_005199 [Penicillium lividum]|nr:hypothetical protein N7490_005199 [Penicillium lividum]